MVSFAAVMAPAADNHAVVLEPDAGHTGSTVARRPDADSAREQTPPSAEDNSRQKALAVLILMLKEGRGAR
jgi:hypothetical protein